MADRIIQTADLKNIEQNLNYLYDGLRETNNNILDVEGKVRSLQDEIFNFRSAFEEFQKQEQREHWLGQAKTDIVSIRQALENQFGHYKQVRRTAVGILQATDIGVVRRETMQNAGENLMISTPNYWLAPCIVALVAWINNNSDLSKIALKEAIKRDDEKTSLFFALVCRRANRKSSCLNWTTRYLELQNEEDLDTKAVVILDAYTSGLLGADSEGRVGNQIERWLEHLSAKPGFIENQIDQWSQAMLGKRTPYLNNGYVYLAKYSPTWSALTDVMSGAYLHDTIYHYFDNIFAQPASTETTKKQLDTILNSLVSDYDEEEIPLRMDERLNELIIEYEGDKPRAKNQMQSEKKLFDVHKDFTRLLTDAAMRPEISHSQVSTQKFAIALSKDWIQDAYQDLTAKNRMKIPANVEINLNGFKDFSVDGCDEEKIISRYDDYINNLRREDIKRLQPTWYEKNSHFIGGAVAILGLILLFKSPFLGVLLLISGGFIIWRHFALEKERAQKITNLNVQYDELLKTNTQIIRALCAEIVDFRNEFKEKDSESQKVIDFMENLNSDQFVMKGNAKERKINL